MKLNKIRIKTILFVAGSMIFLSQHAFAGNFGLNSLFPPENQTCPVNFGHGVMRSIPQILVADCDHGRKEIDTDFIAFFVHYPSLRFTAVGDPVPNTAKAFQIYVTSFYQNPKNNSRWESWPSTLVQNHIDEFGPINTYPTVYRGMFQIIPVSAMKAHPDNDTRHAPGLFIADPHSENQFYIVCGTPVSDVECIANVYNTKTHFEYHMHYPAIAIDKTIDIVNAIAKTVDSWK